MFNRVHSVYSMKVNEEREEEKQKGTQRTERRREEGGRKSWTQMEEMFNTY